MPINLGAKKQVNYLEFDGVNDYVDINHKVIPNDTEEVSYQVKFNYDGSGGGTDGRRFLLESYPVWSLSFDISSNDEMQIFQNLKTASNISFDTGFFVATKLIEGNANIEGSLTVDGLLTAGIDFVTSCPTGANTIGFKVYTGSVDCATKFSGWIYFVEED